jgi:hypothetical protein
MLGRGGGVTLWGRGVEEQKKAGGGGGHALGGGAEEAGEVEVA